MSTSRSFKRVTVITIVAVMAMMAIMPVATYANDSGHRNTALVVAGIAALLLLGNADRDNHHRYYDRDDYGRFGYGNTWGSGRDNGGDRDDHRGFSGRSSDRGGHRGGDRGGGWNR